MTITVEKYQGKFQRFDLPHKYLGVAICPYYSNTPEQIGLKKGTIK